MTMTQSSTPSIEAQVNTLHAAIKAKRQEYQAKFDKVPSAELRAITEEVKRLGDKLTGLITFGAEPCEGYTPPKGAHVECGRHPLGLVQEVAIKGQPVPYFEVGCLSCPDKRAQGFTVAQAVEAWNAERYLPPKTG